MASQTISLTCYSADNPMPPDSTTLTTQGTPTVPPPPDDKYDQSGKDKTLSVINAMTGGGNKAIQQKIDEDHQRKLTDIAMFRNVAKSSYDALLSGKNAQGKDMTPEEKQQQLATYNSAWAQYKKLAGTGKEAKGILGKMEAFAGHVLKAHGAQPASTAGAGGAGGAATPRGQTVAPPPAMVADQGGIS